MNPERYFFKGPLTKRLNIYPSRKLAFLQIVGTTVAVPAWGFTQGEKGAQVSRREASFFIQGTPTELRVSYAGDEQPLMLKGIRLYGQWLPEGPIPVWYRKALPFKMYLNYNSGITCHIKRERIEGCSLHSQRNNNATVWLWE